ncbi:MAG: hypothetical protein WC859_08780 [Elusimicrobiota bacterium]|jgi:hypothetical protein
MFDWTLAPPKETFAGQRQNPISLESAVVISASGLFSAALAESIPSSSSGQELALVFFSTLLVFLFFVMLYHQLSRLFSDDAPSGGVWFRAGAIVVVPAHLLLPAALLCRPFGSYGLALYGLAKLVVLSWMIRRGQWAVQSLLGWPAWASVLLMGSPLVLGVVGVVVAVCLMLFAAGAVVVASLS